MTKLALVTEQVVLYEDELADNGVSLLTVKVVRFQSCYVISILFLHPSRWLSTNHILLSTFLESHAKLLVSSPTILGESTILVQYIPT